MAESKLPKNMAPFVYTRTLSTSDDLDNLIGYSNEGIYNIQESVKNGPGSGAAWGLLLVFTTGSSRGRQIIFSENGIYFRSHMGNPVVWSSWKRYAPAG